MKAWLWMASSIALAGCAGMPASQPPSLQFALLNSGFEEMPKPGDCARGWGCVAHADPSSFRFFAGAGAPEGGAASLCLEPVKPQPWAMVIQGHIDRQLGGRRLRFTLDVKTTDVTGKGAGAVVEAHDGHGKYVGEAKKLFTGTHDWQRVVVDFDVPAAAMEVGVGGMLEGRGTLCIDNAHVEVLR